MQDYTSSNAQDNAIALQKFGVGQPVRRKEGRQFHHPLR